MARRRTVSYWRGTFSSSRAKPHCVDPGNAAKASRPIFLGNCQVRRTEANDNDYVTLTTCGAGAPIRTEIRVESDTAYTAIHEGKIGARTTKDIVVARRIGDCRR